MATKRSCILDFAEKSLLKSQIKTRKAFIICCAGGGYIIDKFHKRVELILAICLVFCAALNAVIPYSPHVGVLYAVCTVEGWMEALVNIGKQWQLLM